MQLAFSIPTLADTRRGHTLRAKMLRELLEGVARVNLLILSERPELPRLYRSGVHFRPEDGEETVPDVFTLYEQGHGDCAPLAAARVAELRRNGENATFKLYWRPERKPLPYHVQVRRGDGKTIEDPARLLGMVGRSSD